MKYRKINNASGKRTSDILHEIAETPDKSEMTIGDFITLLGDRSFALAILIFSLPNSLPVPGIPGFSTVTGIPIIFIALQIVCGRKTIWLPHAVGKKHFPQKILTKVIQMATPLVKWMEKFLHPRFTLVCDSKGEVVIGVLIALMAVILALPILGTNFISGACISLLALALLENDGVLGTIGIAVTLVSFFIVYQMSCLIVGGAVDGIQQIVWDWS